VPHRNSHTLAFAALVRELQAAVEREPLKASTRMQAAETLSAGSSALVDSVQALQAANSSMQQASAQLSATVTSLSAQVGTLQVASGCVLLGGIFLLLQIPPSAF
jgi:hypothetical protein